MGKNVNARGKSSHKGPKSLEDRRKTWKKPKENKEIKQ